MQDDLLGFVSKLPDAGNHQPLTIYISALQPDAEFCSNQKNQREIAVPYLMALYDELSRVCGAADIVILNSATMLIAGIDLHLFPEIDPATALFHRGFLLKRRCQYDKVRVYRKE